jgi:hypothetical protein
LAGYDTQRTLDPHREAGLEHGGWGVSQNLESHQIETAFFDIEHLFLFTPTF